MRKVKACIPALEGEKPELRGSRSCAAPACTRVSPGVTTKQLTDPDQVEEHVAWGGVVAAVHEPGLRHLLVAGLRYRGRPVRAGWGDRHGPRRKPREPRPRHIPAPGFS